MRCITLIARFINQGAKVKDIQTTAKPEPPFKFNPVSQLYRTELK